MAFLPINLANVQAATGFDYPPGKYLFQVKSLELRTNTDGNGQRLVVQNEIVMGPGPSTQFAGRPLANSYQMTEKGAPFFKRFCLAVGLDEAFIAANGGQIDESWFPGRQFVAAVVKNGNYCNISNERPIGEWNNGVESAPAGAARPATAPAAAAPPPAQLQPVGVVVPPQMNYAPAPQLPVAPAGVPAGIPAPVPPPGRIGG